MVPWRLVWAVGGLVIAGLLVVVVPNGVVILGAGQASHDPAKEPHAQVALVLGASVYDDGSPTANLADRLKAGAALYKAGKVDRVLVSGDRGQAIEYDQVDVMHREMVRLGVPDRDVFTDHGGFDTWDSMVRAHKVYEVKSAIVVTQGWHMPRALWLAKRAGLKAHGLVAEPVTPGDHGGSFTKHEIFARVKAFVDGVTHAKADVLGPKVPITGSAQASRGPPLNGRH